MGPSDPDPQAEPTTTPPPATEARTDPPSGVSETLRSIGPYRLLQKVGEGGMDEVWLREMERILIRSGQPEQAAKLRQEFPESRGSSQEISRPPRSRATNPG